MSAPTRRAILAGTGAALAGGAIAGPSALAAQASPDPKFLAVAAEALRLEREYCRLCWVTDELDPRFKTPAQPAAAAAFAALQAPYEEAFERLGDLPATTPAGIRAKVEAVAAYYEGMPPDRDGAAGAALWGLVLDLTGQGAET